MFDPRNQWQKDLFQPDDGHGPIARRVRASVRPFVLAARGFVRDEAFHHAASLCFDTVLALLPLLVIVLAMLRGLGAYEAFLNETLRPWIDDAFGAAPQGVHTMREALLQILALGESVDLGALGFVGVVLLLYLVLVLLVTVEGTFNRIWGVRRPRSLVRRASDYAAILFVIPFGAIFATTLGRTIGAGASWLGPARPILTTAAGILSTAAVLSFLYLVMPHTRVRWRSAAIGGVTAGLGFTLVLWAYATFQIGVARYNALYSSFAAIPLFLVWVFVSWLVVLYGAEVAAAHQNPRGYRWRIRHREPSAATRRRLALRFMVEATEKFVRAEPPPSLTHLGTIGAVPEELARMLLDDLVTAKLLVHARNGNVTAYALARDPGTVKVTDVLRAIDETEDPHELARDADQPKDLEVARVLARIDEAREASSCDYDLRTLVEAIEARVSDPPSEASGKWLS